MSESYIAKQIRQRREFEDRRKSAGRTRKEQVAVDNSNSPQAVQERRAAATKKRAEELREKGASQAAIDATGVNDRVTITQPARDAQGRTATDRAQAINEQRSSAEAVVLQSLAESRQRVQENQKRESFSVVGPSGPPKKGLDKVAEEFRARSLTEILYGDDAKGQVLGFVAGYTQGASDLLRFGKALVTKPVSTTESAAKGLYSLARNPKPALDRFGRNLQYRPGEVIGGVAFDATMAVGANKIRLVERVQDVSDVVRGKRIPVQQLDDGPAFVVKSGTDEVTIGLKGGVDSTALPIKEQLSYAGTIRDTASAQRGFFGFNRRTVVIDKPKPTPTSPELERSFFLDPNANLRQSRLGTQEPSVSDIFSGSVRIDFKPQRPQAVFIRDTPVESFPSSLSDVVKKLQSGKPLSSGQAYRLEKFQLTPSGQAKPLGFVSREAEVTIPPGEALQRVQRVGSVKLDGRKVDVFEARIVPGSSVQADLKGVARFSPSSDLSPSFNPTPSLTAVSFSSASGSERVTGVIRKPIFVDSPSPFAAKTRTANLRNTNPRPARSQPVSASLRPTLSFVSDSSPPSRRVIFFGGSGGSGGSRSPRGSGGSGGSPSPSSPSPSPFSPPPGSGGSPGGGSGRGSGGSGGSSGGGSGGSGGSPRIPPYTPRIPTYTPTYTSLRQSDFKPQGFRALVKIGGEFRPVGPVLSRREALEFGARKVAQTPAASFKIQAAGRSVETTLGLKGFFTGFGRSKTDEDVFVEPNKLRINTPGELRGITFKGIKASRFKKIL